MKGELLEFHTKDKLRLFGFLAPAKGKKAYVHIHSWIGNFYENSFLPPIAQAVNAKGMAFFSFTNRGTGMITDIPKTNGAYKRVGGSIEKFEDCIKDIKAALDFLNKRGYKSFVLQGHSLGCQKTAYYKYKTQDPRVDGIVLLGPVDDVYTVKWMLKNRYFQALEIASSMQPDEVVPEWMRFYPGLVARRFLDISDPSTTHARVLDYEGELKELRAVNVPILAVFGNKDDYQKNAPQVLKFLKKEIKCSTKLLSTNHWFSGKEKQLAKAIAAWLSRI